MNMENIYDCPIHEQIGQLRTMMANEHDKMLMKAVQEVGIEIDKESLVQAIHNDRLRYEDAYKKGYADCKKEYEEKMKSIADIIGVF